MHTQYFTFIRIAVPGSLALDKSEQVSLTFDIAVSQIKCAQYWPSPEREAEIYEEFVVKLNSEDHCPDYIIRSLSLTNVSPHQRFLKTNTSVTIEMPLLSWISKICTCCASHNNALNINRSVHTFIYMCVRVCTGICVSHV